MFLWVDWAQQGRSHLGLSRLSPVLAQLEQLQAGQACLTLRQPPHLASSQQSNATAVELHT